MPAGERGLARARDAHQDDQAQLGDLSSVMVAAPPLCTGAARARAVNTAIWVGGPASGSVRRRPAGNAPGSRAPGRSRPPSRGTRRGSTRTGGPGAASRRGAGRVMRVVLRVRRGDHHGARPGRAEHGLLQRAQPGRVHVLDDLHQHGRVQPGQPLVGVGQRRLEQRQPLPLPRPASGRCAAAGRPFQRPVRTRPRRRPGRTDGVAAAASPTRRALAAAEVGDGADACLAQHGRARCPGAPAAAARAARRPGGAASAGRQWLVAGRDRVVQVGRARVVDLRQARRRADSVSSRWCAR